MREKLLIDTDTASDDAVALVLALKDPRAAIEAITVVAGNVPLDQGVQNALYTVELAGSSVPVFAGASAPLARPLETAQFVHGEDGMGDCGLPLRGRVPKPVDAVDVIVNTVNDHPREITLVTLGPLTNVAMAIQREPSLGTRVKRCVIMGGTGDGPGNVTAMAEYNIWVDPEAAAMVFGSGMPTRLVGWDISTRYATFSADEAAGLRAIGTDLARFCVDIQATLTRYAVETSGLPGFDLPDPITMAIALEPEIATRTRRALVTVGTGNGADRGQVFVEQDPQGTVELILEADRERFVAMLRGALE